MVIRALELDKKAASGRGEGFWVWILPAIEALKALLAELLIGVLKSVLLITEVVILLDSAMVAIDNRSKVRGSFKYGGRNTKKNILPAMNKHTEKFLSSTLLNS